MSPYICVHGHFYQPPRENPWLEAIEPQDSAAPYHDWNERILAECYAPNSASRILDEDDRIVAIVNNYARISFDFGPTLLAWMERVAPACYAAILEADRESRGRFSGHGSALAQVYNHIIMPLATERDQEIQIVWGIRDFEHRFGRKPEGMWLAETAVDTRTLEVLARHDIRFTILAPSQARRARRMGEGEWRDVSGGHVDSARAYVQKLPSGREITLFFYDSVVSKAIAFEGLLHRGEALANRLLTAQRGEDGPRLAHVATDGESYGHHHPHGDMALAFALDLVARQDGASLTNYGEFLERFPPQYEVQILENSSWSCAHGVERWRNDCGCHTGGPPGWTQAWRAPLREALDRLRDAVRPSCDAKLADTFDEPRSAVLRYVDLVLDRSPASLEAYFDAHPCNDRVHALKLLELERQLQLMYTSCGWFFNDLAGIETIQILRYAGRALQLAEDVLEERFEPPFLDELERARSNRIPMGNGRDLYQRHVVPSKITWEMLCAHYCISSLFETEDGRVYCYDVERESVERRQVGRTRMLLGRVKLTSRITCASERLGFAVFHLGDHNVTAGVERLRGDALASELVAPFLRGDTASVRKLMQERFAGRTFDLRSLFGDEQRKILDVLLRATLEEAEAAHRHIYEHHWGSVRFLAELGAPLPAALSVAAEVVLNARLRRALADPRSDVDEIGDAVREAATEGVRLDEPTLAFTARRGLEALAEAYFAAPHDEDKLDALRERVRLAKALPFEVDLWQVQNLYFQCKERVGLEGNEKPDRFLELGDELEVRTS